MLKLLFGLLSSSVTFFLVRGFLWDVCVAGGFLVVLIGLDFDVCAISSEFSSESSLSFSSEDSPLLLSS